MTAVLDYWNDTATAQTIRQSRPRLATSLRRSR
jgi:hypothetical protein